MSFGSFVVDNCDVIIFKLYQISTSISKEIYSYMTYKLKVYVSGKSSFNLEKRLGWLEKNYRCKGVETGILTRHVAREKGQNQFTFYK